jgi:hypothetical protein
MSVYRILIDETTHVLQRRARYYRDLIVAVVLVGLVAGVWSLVARSPAPLLGLVLAVPLSGLFIFLDHKVLEGWCTRLLEVWSTRELDLSAFAAAIRANPALPKETTEGMLATLPLAGSLVEEQRMTIATRQAVAAKALERHRSISEVVILKTLVASVSAAALIVAVGTHQTRPLALLATVAVVPVMRIGMKRRRAAESECRIAACRGQPGFSKHEYERLVATLK